MKISNIINSVYRRCRLSGTLVFTLIVLMSSPAFGVGLYDVWETKVTNSKTYSNPFDYTVIELKATFTSPNGAKTNFFGFYDGNGNGGQTGNVWKLRFMPDKTGTWTYTYSWTDGTSGGSGSFNVVDTGLPGPLKIATDNPWYFKDSRGKPFHFRGYDLHGINYKNSFVSSRKTANIVLEESRVRSLIDTMVGRGYNFTMIMLEVDRTKKRPDAWGNRSFWLNTSDTKRFDLPVWHTWERLIKRMGDKRVYAIPFTGMIAQKSEYGFSDFKVFMRYFVARFGANYNFFGWSPTWEWTRIWSDSQVNQIMEQVQAWDPFPRLLTIHDCSDNNLKGWLDFSMRQAVRGTPSGKVRNVFDANSRLAGQQQGSCDAPEGVGAPFLNRPIIGSEDIWENSQGVWGHPRNGTEVRRAAWGIQMAGVMPLYSEWNIWLGGGGQGEPDMRRMFDFFYSKTKYRQYKQLNSLVSSSARQIASGKAGLEYLVYDENGGSITINLSGAGGSNTFDVLWYNPTSGATQNGGTVNGGASRTLNSPYSGDTVLLLTKGASDTTSPVSPKGLTIN